MLIRDSWSGEQIHWISTISAVYLQSSYAMFHLLGSQHTYNTDTNIKHNLHFASHAALDSNILYNQPLEVISIRTSFCMQVDTASLTFRAANEQQYAVSLGSPCHRVNQAPFDMKNA